MQSFVLFCRAFCTFLCYFALPLPLPLASLASGPTGRGFFFTTVAQVVSSPWTGSRFGASSGLAADLGLAPFGAGLVLGAASDELSSSLVWVPFSILELELLPDLWSSGPGQIRVEKNGSPVRKLHWTRKQFKMSSTAAGALGRLGVFATCTKQNIMKAPVIYPAHLCQALQAVLPGFLLEQMQNTHTNKQCIFTSKTKSSSPPGLLPLAGATGAMTQ